MSEAESQRSHRLHGLIGIIVTLFLAASCRAKSTEPPLIVGTNVWPGYEPLYLARSLDYYSDERVRLVEYSSATQVIRAFRNGTIQVAALTLDEVLTLKQRGIGVQVVLITDLSMGADTILTKPGTKTMASLRGKRVGVESSAVGAYVLTRALELASLRSDEIVVVPLGVDKHEEAFRRGEVDAVVTFEPVRSRLLAAGAEEVFTSREIPGEVVDVLAVRADLLASRPDALDELLVGWFRALQFQRENPDAAAERARPRLKLSLADIRVAFSGLEMPTLEANLEQLTGSEPPLRRSAEKLAAAMRESNLLEEVPALEDLIDAQPLRRVQSQAGSRQ